MQNRWLWAASLIAMAIASSTLTWLLAKRSADDKAVYLIGAVTITDAERLPEYQAMAGPLATKTGGYVPLAFSEPTMIEGGTDRNELMRQRDSFDKRSRSNESFHRRAAALALYTERVSARHWKRLSLRSWLRARQSPNERKPEGRDDQYMVGR